MGADVRHAWLERLHPDDREQADAKTEEFVRSADDLAIEFRIIHPQNGERWIQGRGRMQRDPEGRPLRMIGVNFDTTEQRRAQESLRESEQRIRDIAENFPGIIFRRITYPDGRIEYPFVSGGDRTVFDFSRKHLSGIRTLEEITRHIHFDDVSETLARSAERERAATMLRMSIEVAGVGTWEYDPLEKTIRGSSITNAAFGLPDDSAERPLRAYIEAVHPQDCPWVERDILGDGKKRAGTSREYRITDGAGGVRWINTVGTYVRLADGTARMIGALSDVTARKRHEEEREAHLRYQGDLLQQLNHRVKNNLQVVQSLMPIEAGRPFEADEDGGPSRLERAMMKVAIVAGLHARLSFVSGSGQIDFRAFLQDMTEKLRASLPAETSVEFESGTGTCVLELDLALPLGLAVHELTTSALARGPAGGRTIAVRLDCGPPGTKAVTVTTDREEGTCVGGLNLRLVKGIRSQAGAALEHLEAPAVGHRIRFHRDPGSS